MSIFTDTVLYTNGEAVGTFVIAEKPAEPEEPADPEKPTEPEESEKPAEPDKEDAADKPAGPAADDGDEDVVAQTGDSADITPWIALILVSGMSMTAAVIIRRKKR